MTPEKNFVEGILPLSVLSLLVIGCVAILLPFLTALLWAAILCFSTWPLYRWLERKVNGRKSLAAVLMTMLVTIVLIAPLALVIASLADNMRGFVVTAINALEVGLPEPPDWVLGLPLIGPELSDYWASLSHNSPAFTAELKSLIGPAADVALATGKRIGKGLFELSLSVFIAYFFFRHGQSMIAYAHDIMERFGGERAKRLILVAGGTIKGVVYGLIGTALVQSALAAIGFKIAGVPLVLLLSFLTFVLSFAPVGPPLVWGSVAVWLIASGEIGWGIFVALWGLLLVSAIDNILRPYLIGKTSDLPILLSLFGLFGGVIAFGLVGVFLGPTLLAVGYSLFLDWMADGTGKAPRKVPMA